MIMEKRLVIIHQTDKENEEYRRKLVPQVRCGMSKRAVCDLDTGVNLEKN